MEMSKVERAKVILRLLDRVAKKHGGDLAAAAGELDHDLGPLWRKEVEAGGLGSSIPESTKECAQSKAVESFYKRVKRKLEEAGESENSIDDGRIPMETNADHKQLLGRKRPKKKRMMENMAVLVIGKK